MRIHAFSLPFDSVTMNQALSVAQLFLSDDRQHYIVTPNPEMVMLTKKDIFFAAALRKADLCLIDGVGLMLALRLITKRRIERIPGTDFLERLLGVLKNKRSIFLLGGEGGAGQRAAQLFRERYQSNIVGTDEPPRGIYDASGKLSILDNHRHQELLSVIQRNRPDVLVVALGHNLQEKWMQQFLSELPTVKVAIGVGGALDYLSGDIPRAPAPMRLFGLEWLWRFIFQPWRWRRIITATIAFPIETLRWYISMHFFYRPSVIACIQNDEGSILLVSRRDNPQHWQFPQGGQEDGESTSEAVLREMHEELGTDKLEIVGQSRPNIHRYAWKGSAAQSFSTDTSASRHYGYRGQKQTIFYLRFTGQDSDIHLDEAEHTQWRWVKPAELLQILHPVRHPVGAIILKEIHGK